MDYRFSGGVLEDGSPWALGTVYFFLDGAPTFGYAIASPVLLPPSLNGCRDTMWGNRRSKEYSAATFASAYIIDGIVTDTLRLQFMLESWFTALKSPVVHAIGLGGNRTGVDVGARCQRLYVDLGKPVVFVIRLGPFPRMSWTVPWQPVLANLGLYAQAAWADSQGGAFSLTVASKVTLPSGPASTQSSLHFRTIHDSQNPAATVGLGPTLDSRLFPITQYTVR